MAQSPKALLVAGAKPNFMKIDPIIRAIHAWNASANSIQSQDSRLKAGH